jgi:hypothetical protein
LQNDDAEISEHFYLWQLEVTEAQAEIDRPLPQEKEYHEKPARLIKVHSQLTLDE